MQCKSLFLWSEDDIATSSNEMTPIEVNLTIAVITEYHMSGWSEDGLPLPPIWISQIYGLEYGLDLLHVIQ